jgi:hypothetical protein
MPSLKQCLTLPDNYNWGGRVETPTGPYFHHSYGGRVLGVAHLDTVLQATPRKSGNYVFAPQLDDRLGVWCLLNALPKMGIQLDILLTTGEETCQTTAREFPLSDYNWVVEFDRAGTDVVLYQYDTKLWADTWRGWKIGRGSFSDIVDLDLGVCCANIGIGYHNQHSYYCHANLDDTQKQLFKFAQFYEKNKDTKFEFEFEFDGFNSFDSLEELDSRYDEFDSYESWLYSKVKA